MVPRGSWQQVAIHSPNWVCSSDDNRTCCPLTVKEGLQPQPSYSNLDHFIHSCNLSTHTIYEPVTGYINHAFYCLYADTLTTWGLADSERTDSLRVSQFLEIVKAWAMHCKPTNPELPPSSVGVTLWAPLHPPHHSRARYQMTRDRLYAPELSETFQPHQSWVCFTLSHPRLPTETTINSLATFPSDSICFPGYCSMAPCPWGLRATNYLFNGSCRNLLTLPHLNRNKTTYILK